MVLLMAKGTQWAATAVVASDFSLVGEDGGMQLSHYSIEIEQDYPKSPQIAPEIAPDYPKSPRNSPPSCLAHF
jgi:hypothetical protein